MLLECFGRECKLGLGYNESLDQFIPVEKGFLNIKPELVGDKYSSWICDMSCDVIPCYDRINFYLESSIKKILDFQIVFDEKEYWYLKCDIYRRDERCNKLPEYPLICSHYVNRVIHGVDLIIIFPKIGFSDDKKKVEKLLADRTLDTSQKKINCRVLINYDEIKEVTLEELMEFRNDLETGEHPELDVPVCFDYEKLDQKSREVKVTNECEFGYFLSYLYSVYRKIEMKMEKLKYPYILPDFDSEKKSFAEICFNLEKTKDEYKCMQKNNFLKMYPILKKLFYCYLDYIKYGLDHLDIIDASNFLPGGIEELQIWLCELNKWFLVNINGHWHSCMNSVIVSNNKNETILRKLKITENLRNTNVIISNEVTEPIVVTEKNPEGTKFGFINMSFAENDQAEEDLPPLEMECPKSCSDLRKWICTKCGDFARVKSMGQIFLFCSCGKKRFSAKLLICPKCQGGEKEKPQKPSNSENSSVLIGNNQSSSDIQTPPVPEPKDKVLSLILTQLQKYVRNKSADDRVVLAIEIILKEKNDLIRIIFDKLMQTSLLDGDTVRLIQTYLTDH